MSLTSANDRLENPDFSNLLVHYPSLATWLADVLRGPKKLKAEEIFLSFLAECANQGVPDGSYPFSAEDRARADLHTFLQSGEEGINTPAASPAKRIAAMPLIPQNGRKRNRKRQPHKSAHLATSQQSSKTPEHKKATGKHPTIKISATASTRGKQTFNTSAIENVQPKQENIPSVDTPLSDRTLDETTSPLENTLDEVTPSPENILTEITPSLENSLAETTPSLESIPSNDIPSLENTLAETMLSPESIHDEITPSSESIPNNSMPSPENTLDETTSRLKSVHAETLSPKNTLDEITPSPEGMPNDDRTPLENTLDETTPSPEGMPNDDRIPLENSLDEAMPLPENMPNDDRIPLENTLDETTSPFESTLDEIIPSSENTPNETSESTLDEIIPSSENTPNDEITPLKRLLTRLHLRRRALIVRSSLPESTSDETTSLQESIPGDDTPLLKSTPDEIISLQEGIPAETISPSENMPDELTSTPENAEIVAPHQPESISLNTIPQSENAEVESSVSQPAQADPIMDSAESEAETQKQPMAEARSRRGKSGTSRPERRTRKERPRRKRSGRQLLVIWALLILILAAILVPVGFLVNFGISAYHTYQQLDTEAHTAVGHLLAVKDIFSGGKSHLDTVLDVAKLQQANKEFGSAEQSFQQLQNQLNHSSTISTVTTYLPQYRTTIKSVQEACLIGIDVSQLGLIVTTQGETLAPSFKGPLLSTSNKPLVTQPMLDTIGTTINQVLPLINDIQAHSQDLSLASLPISSAQKSEITQIFQLLPEAVNDLGQVNELLGAAGWLLGVDQPRTFLLQTMDRAELRPTGGFTGQYGELTINGGRLGGFNLTDIALLEYTTTSVTNGQSAPAQYSSWWPFANWGLRDSNISADFPTAAPLAIKLYKEETGNQVDGVINLTPVVLEHILAAIGPIQVPGYNVTVTSQNLEDLLHYYQLDNSGILKQILSQPGDNSTSQRKRFTNYLATLVMNKVRSSSPDQLLSIAHQVLNDLKTKDLQMYFTDPTAENVLMQYKDAGQLNRSLTQDGLFVVQANIGASKASQYVQTIMHDVVTLNSQGGATHVLQLRLIYNQAGPVYGYDTYDDYVRVYVPPNSKLLSGDGFVTGKPLCDGGYSICSTTNPYPGGEMVCPAGQYQPGATAPNLQGSNGGTLEPLQVLGGPTNTTSDEPERAMYGGLIVLPKNCTLTVTLSWYVPPLSQQPYSLLVQRQAGTFPELDLTIQPTSGDCSKLGISGVHFDKTLTEDMTFTPARYNPKAQNTQGCYPQQGV